MKTFLKFATVIIVIVIFAVLSLEITARNLGYMLGEEKVNNNKFIANIMTLKETTIDNQLLIKAKNLGNKLQDKININLVKDCINVYIKPVGSWINNKTKDILPYVVKLQKKD